MKTILFFKGSDRSSNTVSYFKNIFTKKNKSKEERYLDLYLNDFEFINVEKRNVEKFISKKMDLDEEYEFWISDEDKETLDLINNKFEDVKIHIYPEKGEKFLSYTSFKYILNYYIKKALYEAGYITVYKINNWKIETIDISALEFKEAFKCKYGESAIIQSYGRVFKNEKGANESLDESLQRELNNVESMIKYYSNKKNEIENIIKDRK